MKKRFIVIACAMTGLAMFLINGPSMSTDLTTNALAESHPTSGRLSEKDASPPGYHFYAIIPQGVKYLGGSGEEDSIRIAILSKEEADTLKHKLRNNNSGTAQLLQRDKRFVPLYIEHLEEQNQRLDSIRNETHKQQFEIGCTVIIEVEKEGIQTTIKICFGKFTSGTSNQTSFYYSPKQAKKKIYQNGRGNFIVGTIHTHIKDSGPSEPESIYDDGENDVKSQETLPVPWFVIGPTAKHVRHKTGKYFRHHSYSGNNILLEALKLWTGQPCRDCQNIDVR